MSGAGWDARDALAAIFDHYDHRAQAPGHSHDIPGVWDKDIGNGDKGGTACEWCATWERARACITAHQPGPRPAFYAESTVAGEHPNAAQVVTYEGFLRAVKRMGVGV